MIDGSTTGAWCRVYDGTYPWWTTGTYRVMFFIAGFDIPSRNAVVDDFGNLVEVPQ